MEKIFFIPDENMTQLEEKLAMLIKRASKLHTSPISYAVIGQEVKPVTWRDYSLDPCGELKTRDAIFHQIEVRGDTPRVNGFTFIASIDHMLEEGNIVACVPGMCSEGELTAYRNALPTCEHCHLKRSRNTTYILRNDEARAYIQVGRNCLADFLREDSNLHDEINALTVLCELCALCSQAEEYDDMARGTRRNFIPLEEYLHNVSASIQEDGWVSSAKARETFDLVATKQRAFDSWLGYSKELTYNVTLADKEKTSRALTWIRDMSNETLSDYMYSLFTVCKGSVLSIKHMGIAASLFVAYDKAMQVVYEKSHTAVSSHVGAINEKITVTVKVLKETPINGNYGTSYLYAMVDETSGNRFKWFSSKPILGDEIDNTVTLMGTVKAHEVYNNVKSTVLTRCKVK